ncbi:hypothetical protein [Thiothrix lacustris]|uniref:hypothetical protein n=1 Tax=Thiothrix lacustris TaxID=525917 RepID=UPI0027E4DD6B|nr:hypothetical protein [Thiothrix lacustris]WMP17777.1 hypothetical protein RCS87_01615 [Thiothrix lacustris]
MRTATNPYSHLPYQRKPRYPAPYNPDDLMMTFARAVHTANCSQDAALRRVAVMYHPTILATWVEQGFSRVTIATKLLGLPSWAKLRLWLYDHHLLDDFNATYCAAADLFYESAAASEMYACGIHTESILFTVDAYRHFTPVELLRMAGRNNPAKYTAKGNLRPLPFPSPNN